MTHFLGEKGRGEGEEYSVGLYRTIQKKNFFKKKFSPNFNNRVNIFSLKHWKATKNVIFKGQRQIIYVKIQRYSTKFK